MPEARKARFCCVFEAALTRPLELDFVFNGKLHTYLAGHERAVALYFGLCPS
jgi:hypothetical protein